MDVDSIGPHLLKAFPSCLVIISYRIENNYVFTRETKTDRSLLNATNIDITLNKIKAEIESLHFYLREPYFDQKP